MPLVKQGKFKEYYNKCEEIKYNAEKCHNQHFDEDGNYNLFDDVFSGYFYFVDNIYREAFSMKTKLENLLEISEQKTDKSVERCVRYIEDMSEVIRLCIEDFKRVYDSFHNGFSDMERDTFQNYAIYKDI